VECDASLMDGYTAAYGSVGAVSGKLPLHEIEKLPKHITGIKNPITLARHILEYSRRPDLLGRIPPMHVGIWIYSS
jgi:taspase (threonine aspartase 1)